MKLMQKAIDANPMMEGRQRRRKRYVGPESLETQVNDILIKKLKRTLFSLTNLHLLSLLSY